MKKIAIILMVIALMTAAAMSAYNRKQTPSDNNEGMNMITENTDSTILLGQHLVKSVSYSDKDWNAILAYLKTVKETK